VFENQQLDLGGCMVTTLRRTALLSAVVGTLLVTGTAVATADSEVCTAGSGCAGRATFTTANQTFTVYDQNGDGHSAVAIYWLADGNVSTTIWSSGGNGTHVTKQISIPAGSWVTYKVCLGEGGPKEVMQETCGAAKTEVV
jgi:hypothetical protein